MLVGMTLIGELLSSINDHNDTTNMVHRPSPIPIQVNHDEVGRLALTGVDGMMIKACFVRDTSFLLPEYPLNSFFCSLSLIYANSGVSCLQFTICTKRVGLNV